MDLIAADGTVIGTAPAPIAVVSDNGPCCRGATFAEAFADGDALAVEVALFRQTYNTLRPHQALADRTPRDAYLAHPTGNQ